MRATHLLCVAVVLSGCASLSKAKAAEAMQCPETEVAEARLPPKEDEGAKAMVALLVWPLAPTSVVPVRPETWWTGCGKTFACDREGCGETAPSRAARLTRAVPALMEKSRLRLGADATAEQAGYFTWDLRSPRGDTHCRIVSDALFQCMPDVDTLARGTPPL